MRFYSYHLVSADVLETHVVQQFSGRHWTIVPVFAPSTVVGRCLGDADYMQAVNLRSRDKPEIDVWYAHPGEEAAYRAFLNAIDTALAREPRQLLRDGRLLTIGPGASRMGYLGDLPEDKPELVKRDILNVFDLLRSPTPLESLEEYAALKKRSAKRIESRETIRLVIAAISAAAGIAKLAV